MDCAFQSGAFQSNAFQVCVPDTTIQRGSHRRNKRIDYGGYQKQVQDDIERHEMKLSEELARKLQEQIEFNNAMMVVNANLLKANNNILGVVNEIQQKANVVPQKPEMDPRKKAELTARLEAARAAKEAKKQAEEEKRKQMLKNLAKARKARGK